jgi:CRP-like cAMP-binding protein
MIQDLKVRAFFANSPTRQYRRKQIIIHADDIPNYAFYLQQGRVKCYRISEEGNEIVLDIIRPKTIFPISAITRENESGFFYEALDDVRLKLMSPAKARNFYQQNSGELFKLLQATCTSLEKHMDKLSYTLGSSAYSRLVYELIKECESNQDVSKSINRNEHELQVHAYELANQAGLSRETASRELQ